MGLTAAGIAGAVTPPWLGDLAPRSNAAAPRVADPDLVVVNAKVYTVDPAAPRAEAFAVNGGRFIAVGSSRRDQRARRQAHADVRREADDDRARLHRLPQPRRRHDAALRSARRQSVRGRVRHDRQHHREAAREGAADAAGHLGRGLLPRRHEAQGQAAAQRARPRPGVDRASGRRAAIAAATRRSTTARRSSWRGVTKDTPNPPAERSTATRTAS